MKKPTSKKPAKKAPKSKTMKWEKIVSIEPCGEAEVACIKVSAPDELYITGSGIVTHNTSSDPNKLPPAYIDENGEVQVLDFVRPEDRNKAITEAVHIADLQQAPPDLAKIYADAPQDVKAQAERNVASRLFSQSEKTQNEEQITLGTTNQASRVSTSRSKGVEATGGHNVYDSPFFAPLEGRQLRFFRAELAKAQPLVESLGASFRILDRSSANAMLAETRIPFSPAYFSPSTKQIVFAPTAFHSGATEPVIAAYIREEIIHAAQKAATDKQYENDPTIADSADEHYLNTYRKITKELLSTPAGREVLTRSLQVYKSGTRPDPTRFTQDEMEKHLEIYELPIVELARQIIQLRESNTTTEQQLRTAWEAITEWFNQAIETLRSIAKKSPSPLLDATIKDVESLLFSQSAITSQIQENESRIADLKEKLSSNSLFSQSSPTSKADTEVSPQSPVATTIDGIPAKDIFASAKDKFGITKSIYEGGYLLPDGVMLDFSGRSQTGEYTKATDGTFRAKQGGKDWMRDQRTVDHREIEWEGMPEYNKPSSMIDFLRLGAIRIDGRAGMISLHSRISPTASQHRILKDIVTSSGGAYLDLEDDAGNRSAMSLESDKYPKVQRLLNQWASGKTPEYEGVLFSQAAPSQEDADYLAAVEKGDMETAQRMVDEAAKNGRALENIGRTSIYTIQLPYNATDIPETMIARKLFVLAHENGFKLSSIGSTEWSKYPEKRDVISSDLNLETEIHSIQKLEKYIERNNDDSSAKKELKERIADAMFLINQAKAINSEISVKSLKLSYALASAIEYFKEPDKYYFPYSLTDSKEYFLGDDIPNDVREKNKDAIRKGKDKIVELLIRYLARGNPITISELLSAANPQSGDIESGGEYGTAVAFASLHDAYKEMIEYDGDVFEGMYILELEKTLLSLKEGYINRRFNELNLPISLENETDEFNSFFLFLEEHSPTENEKLLAQKIKEDASYIYNIDYALENGLPQKFTADPVTYDDAGNVIPLSQRFNQAKEDIRYSKEDVNEPFTYDELRTREITLAATQYFGGTLPSNVEIVNDNFLTWAGLYDNGKILLNAARLNPTKTQYTIEHEIGHHLYTDEQFQKYFDTLWKSLSKAQQQKIDRIVEKYYAGELRIAKAEEKQVRALEEIRKIATATPAGKTAWHKFTAYLAKQWRKLTNLTLTDPHALAATMIGIGVERFKGAALTQIAPDTYLSRTAANVRIGADARYSITAYHGTPHKVNKEEGFLTEKIGTGEGVQAYGWGLYYAGAQATGETYQRQLTRDNIGISQLLDGKPILPNSPERAAVEALKRNNNDRHAAIKEMQGGVFAANPTRQAAVKILQSDSPMEVTENNGNLYTVELGIEEDEMLDWDKPLSEQNEKVMGNLRQAKPKAPLYKKMVSRLFASDIPVRQFYKDASAMLGSEKDLSEYLNKIGIHGIRYLDQVSRLNPKTLEEARARVIIARRDAERNPDGVIYQKILKDEEQRLADLEQQQQQNSYNYVIFDGKLVKIIEENGQRLMSQGASRQAATPDEEAEALSLAEQAYEALPQVKQRLLDRVAEFQINRVLEQWRGKIGFMLAPNGKPTKLTERQWAQVRTPLFKRWFGDWEAVAKGSLVNENSVSKVIDENGEPLVVYHGTPDGRWIKETPVFKSESERFGGFGKKQGVHWFADQKRIAETYADDRRAFDYQNAEPLTVPAFLLLLNPLEIDAKGDQWRTAQTRGRTSNIIEEAINAGNDGVIIRNVQDDYQTGPKGRTKPGTTFSAFSSNQIKSYTGNNGAFTQSDIILRSQESPQAGLTPATPATAEELSAITAEKEALEKQNKELKRKLDAIEKPRGTKPAISVEDTNARFEAAYQKAMLEINGERTVGDFRLSHSTDNEIWMGMDQVRKEQFQAQKESEWKEAAHIMVNEDYFNTLYGILAKAGAGESLNPVQTKAAEIIIAQKTNASLFLPQNVEARKELATLIRAVRDTRTVTARTLASFRDPHRTPAQRWKQAVGEALFSPSKKAMKAIDAAVSQASLDAEIARLNEQVNALKTSEGNHKQEISALSEQIKTLQNTASKEDIANHDISTTTAEIEKRLAEMGLTINDLLFEPLELRLVGSKLIAQMAKQRSSKETKVLGLLQSKRGGNLQDIARAMHMELSEVVAISDKWREEMKAKMKAMFKNQNMTIENIDMAGVDGILRSNPLDQHTRSDEEAEAMAEQALRMMGFFPSEEHDKINIQKPRKPRQTGRKKGKINLAEALMEDIDQIEWVITGDGLPVDKMIDDARAERAKRPRVSASDNLTGDGLPLDNILDQEKDNRVNFPTAFVRDPNNKADVLRFARLLESATRKVTGWDYVNEIFIANVLSAPATAITNITGFAYGIGRFTVGRFVRALINNGRNKDAEQFGEFIPMLRAVIDHAGLAFSNAYEAFRTEYPVTENLMTGTQTDITFMDGNYHVIPGWKGRAVRWALSGLLATDEFAKTLFAYSHAATIAYRLGKAKGLSKENMQRFIATQLRSPESGVWSIAMQEARHVTFQTQLRSWEEIKAEENEVMSIAQVGEGFLHFMSDVKNADFSDCNQIMKLSQFVIRLIFPFVRTPYRLLEIGLSLTPVGAVAKYTAAQYQKRVPSAQKLAYEQAVADAANKKKRVAKLFTEKSSQEYQEAVIAVQKAREAMNESMRNPTLKVGDRSKIQLEAKSGLIMAAMIVASMIRATEGDDDDDDKVFLITGTTPMAENKGGLRKLQEATAPRQSIGVKLPGMSERIWINYKRFDPISTTLATNADLINQTKRTKHGSSALDIPARIFSSIYSQILEKSSLTGLRDANDTLTGGFRDGVVAAATERVATIAISNAIRNLARSSDPKYREKAFLIEKPLEQFLYSILPIAALAPPAKIDERGNEMVKRGNMFTRSFVPGNPSTLPAPTPLNITLQNWNRSNPNAQYGVDVPDAKKTLKQYSKYDITDAQAQRFLIARQRILNTSVTEAGLGKLTRPTPAQIDEIRDLAREATINARKEVLGK